MISLWGKIKDLAEREGRAVLKNLSPLKEGLDNINK